MLMGIGADFIEQTKHCDLGSSDQSRGLALPPLELEYDPNRPAVLLPKVDPNRFRGTDLAWAIGERVSRREYSVEALALEELSFLLWATQGIKRIERQRTMRTVPSAGIRHPFETVLLVDRVQGEAGRLTPGFYRYVATEHKLVEVETRPGLAGEMAAACVGQDFIATSAVTFVWVAVPYRSAWRYGERAYRYLHLDVGHVCQNLYLACEAIGAGCCAIGAYDDDAVNRLLGLDGVEQFAIYLATVGKKQQNR